MPEYFLFDPYGDYLTPSLQGHRLVAGEYRPMRLQDGRLRSRQLNLLLERDGEHLRLVDPAAGRRLPTRAEALQAEKEALRAESQARAAAEAEIARLRAELAAARARAEGRNGR